MISTTLKHPFNLSFRLPLTHEQQGADRYCKQFYQPCNLDLARYLGRLDNLPVLDSLAIRGVFRQSSVNINANVFRVFSAFAKGRLSRKPSIISRWDSKPLAGGCGEAAHHR